MIYLKTMLLAGTALVFIACGGGSSSTSSSISTPPVDPMTERDAVLIMHYAPVGMCEDPNFQNDIKDYVFDLGFIVDYWLFREESLNISCAIYGMANDFDDSGGCTSTDLTLQDPSLIVNEASCVIGFDADITAQPGLSQVRENNNNIVTEISSFIINW